MKPVLWAILTALVWGIVPILEKTGLMRVEPLGGLFFRCLGVSLGLIFLLIFNKNSVQHVLGNFHWSYLLLILGGFLASFIGQIFFYNALKTGDASRVTPLAGAYPLVTFILALFFFGEKLTLGNSLGILLILSGIFFLK